MADISTYIRNIEIASRGEEVRDSIVGALSGMNADLPELAADALFGKVWRTSITLSASWSGPEPYTQVISIDGVTENSLIDLMPGASAYTVLSESGVKAIWAENDEGVITVCCLGAHPSSTLTLQCLVVETGDSDPETMANEVERVTNRVTLISSASTDAKYPTAKAVWELFDSIDVRDGEDGFSPAVTITDITGGHRVNITDKDHPSGQTFDVMDGEDASGDMLASVYDANGDVAEAGGIAAYIEENAQTALTFDEVPTENSDNPVKSGGIYTALSGKQDALTFDNAPTENSQNPVTSGGLYDLYTAIISRFSALETRVTALESGESYEASVADDYLVLTGTAVSVSDDYLEIAGGSAAVSDDYLNL